ncbi:class I SAM-dependent methyltransferase [Halobacterium salinarum]|uniref:class I SAM-dependent methyltransferase n=1 Tax=Halobacterium salinarum TaxID=2242 RepID=UPI0025570BA1|nr:class I SAM-dependent methyltransferase family protein [Halobacterium salinarum]MDL0127878.1 class I SAM-dependent methyltransferase family protein [Halobacterium salinarum]
MRSLAVVVPKPDSQRAIDGLEDEGVYDDRRKVREHDADHVELPVTAEPDAVPFERAIAQADPDPRAPDLGDRLRERGWSAAERERAPSSWAVLGSVILADFTDCPRPGEVGAALLELHREADTVLDRGDGVAGEHRTPDVSVVAGDGDTETVHVEHGTRYALDLAAVMFSPGNKAERARMGDATGPGERVLDMFAGVGYFALPMARAGATVTAVEKNPTAFRFLAENAQLNDVAETLDTILGDCREVDAPADRIVMGYYDALGGGPVGDAASTPGYLDAALDNLVSGGVLHAHSAVPEAELWERPLSRLRAGCQRAGRPAPTVLDTRRVKSHSEGVFHVAIDARVP